MNTINHQGNFSSDGTDKYINIGSGVDWVHVRNLTTIASSTQWVGTEWFWQRGMTNDDAITNFHATASQIISTSTCAVGYNSVTYNGVSLIDTSLKTYGSIVASTGVSAAAPPLVATASTTGLVANKTIVRLTNMLGSTQYSGMDFTVGAVVADTTFALAHVALPVVSALAGEWRVVDYDASYYPRRRYITAISKAASAVVVTSVTNDFTVGEKVRFIVPSAFGMTEINNLVGTVTAVVQTGTTGNNTVTVNINSAAFTTFAFPLTGVSFTQAQLVPIGEDMPTALASGLSSLGGATLDKDFIGFKLGTSSTAAIALGSAGGTSGDAIKWRAGKSFEY